MSGSIDKTNKLYLLDN